jgi:hypothetical protein
MKRKTALDPQSFKALLRQGDPAQELSAEKAERVRRAVAAAAARGTAPAPRPGLRWDLRLVLATSAVTACALALAVGLWREGPPPVPIPPREALAAVAPRRYQIDFATPGGTRIVWTLIREEPGTRRGR